MSSKVYIAGVGIISAIGNNAEECLAALEHEDAGMNTITYLKTIHANEIPVAEVKLNNEELAQMSDRTLHMKDGKMIDEVTPA